jgi:hypothetical protein
VEYSEESSRSSHRAPVFITRLPPQRIINHTINITTPSDVLTSDIAGADATKSESTGR